MCASHHDRMEIKLMNHMRTIGATIAMKYKAMSYFLGQYRLYLGSRSLAYRNTLMHCETVEEPL